MKTIIVGAGLAGSEAAWQLAKRGISVDLCEMRPELMTAAHRSGLFAELVCSNSFRGAQLTNAVGLLKQELKILGSLIMEAAETAAVPAGSALAVDRSSFSTYIDDKLRNHPLINVVSGEVVCLPEATDRTVIIAAGPLCSEKLSLSIRELCGSEHFAFYDAISPIVYADSIEHEQVFRQSRYDKGNGDDYINIPLDRELYYRFVEEVKAAPKFGGHDQVESESIAGLKPFEGCMPIEDMIERGPDTLLFGPFKPKGLIDPRSGKRPFAVLQLRYDDKAGRMYNMVGMQTRMKQSEQKRIFRSLPGLANAEFARLGSIHRNTFINSPRCLQPTLQFRTRQRLFFAGQITGVEGYVESTAGGLLAGINAARQLSNQDPLVLPANTAIGALMAYISDPERKDFQPMNVNFGLMSSYDAELARKEAGRRISKKDLRLRCSQEALEAVRRFAADYHL